MPVVFLQSLDDPRVLPYRNLKDRDLAREGGRFIAEGELVVRRLLASCFQVESVLCIEKKVDELAPLLPPGVPIYSTTPDVVNQIVGFKFHSGVMAVGLRGAGAKLEDLFGTSERRRQGPRTKDQGQRTTLLLCPQIEKSDNLGSLIRIAAGMGAAGMVLGPRCCDPFYRQAVRVSMGAVFSLPIVRSEDFIKDLARLKNEFGVELVASILAENAEPLESCDRTTRAGIILGNETQGLPADLIAACDRRVTIPMAHGTDSLNVSVAAGVFLYHFTRVSQLR